MRDTVVTRHECSNWLAPIVLGMAFCLPLGAQSEPWAPSGDVTLRHDLQVLADSGLIKAPVLSWPLPWSDIVRDLAKVDETSLSQAQLAAITRVRKRIAQETKSGNVRIAAEVAGAYEPDPLRTFADTPREEGEAAFIADWVGERFAWKLEGRVVADAEDGQTFRPDGSYVAANLGNWMLSAGYLDRWWGPGWQGSLILSTNARPVPAISIDRNESTPFDVPVLRWLGPWRFSTFMGQLESDRDYPHTLLFGMRAEIRPVPSLQIAATRTAQWCGDGRPCDLSTFGDLLVGNDNDQPLEEQPGNQLGGFDVRWSWPGGKVPLALYAQGIGEDEAGFLPSKYLGLLGIETWGAWSGRSWRALAEYADTACDFLNTPPEFGCAYTNLVYTTGYRYRGRAIGHATDGDSESIGFSVLLWDRAGRQWRLQSRTSKLNREGAATGHTLTAVPVDLFDVDVAHEREFGWGKLAVSIGFSDAEAQDAVAFEDGLRGFLSLQVPLR